MAARGTARNASPAPAAPPAASHAPSLGYADLISMVELIERANAFSEFRLKVGSIEIEFRRRSDRTGSLPQAPPPATAATAAAAPAVTPAAAADATGPAATERTSATDTDGRARTAPAGARLPPGTIAITAPMVGTFYRAPAPGAKPFVEAGQRVEAGTTLCIIEVMKLMNTVDAATAGNVVEIRAQDAAPVAHDEVLIVFRPED